MDRRQILKYAAMLTGTALCAPVTAAMLSGSGNQLNSSASSAPQFFAADDFQLLTQIMDVILPKTDSPSASDVGVNKVMDHMCAVVFEPDYQQKFSGLFNDLRQFLVANNFAQLAPAQQTDLLRALERSDKQDNAYWAYTDIKQQTVVYYLLSEQIAENYLNYLPVPGEYKPCVSLAELGGKAWAI
ncbi:gluconate 2-dehydrogenase subunit 3 family protein [Neptunicella sp. SCSIO 80796]|uniref:gluconate 2-dehydrogenase subunit 3 family protein n=1 Tax=Neptunicella plasticusilytica TaxID=3117012 RepID=UPI003A4D83E8